MRGIMNSLQKIEEQLDKLFNKSLPALPSNAKKFIVSVAPWVALVGGLLSLYSTYALWQWAHTLSVINNYTNAFNSLYSAYGYGYKAPNTNQMSIVLWIAMVVMLIEGVIYLLAFPGLHKQNKSGWNFLFYGLIVNVVYGIVMIFTSYGGIGSFIAYLIGSAIGAYFLFQIRSLYLNGKSSSSTNS